MCILLLESVVIDIPERTVTEVIEVVVQDDAVKQEEEQVECWSVYCEEEPVGFEWEMCSVPLVSISIMFLEPLPAITKTPLHEDADEQDEEQVK